MPPVGALQELPPLAPVAQINGMTGRAEHQRSGVEHVRQGAGIVLRIGRDFGNSPVSGGADEFFELPVGNWRAVDPEAIDGDAVDRRFFRIVLVGAHAEYAAGNEYHS